MDYITAREASAKWGISVRSIDYHLTDGRIPGAIKKGKLWLIPADAPRPADKRRREQPAPEPASEQAPGFTPELALSADIAHVIAATTLPMPDSNPDAVLAAAGDDRLRRVYETELAYLRGDFARVLDCFHRVNGDDAARLRIFPAAVAAAISMGDYHAYTHMEDHLKGYVKNQPGAAAAMAELALATAAVSCIAPGMAPEWLKHGDFSAFPAPIRPLVLYLRAKYFQCTEEYTSMLVLSQTALSLFQQEPGVTHPGIYLRLCCAMACHGLNQEDEARRWLLEAMRLSLPHGFITPFAESITALGGLVEECLEREFPAYHDAVLRQWERTWKNWMTFHNQFTKSNITLILTLREYHIAVLAARRVPYDKIAKQHHVSVSRIKGIMDVVYGKLFVSKREELAKFIL